MSTTADAVLREPELQTYRAEIDAILADALALTAGLDDARFNWRPSPGRWSIAECFGHLVICGRGFLQAIDALIAETRRRGLAGHGPFRHRGLLADYFIRINEPPVKLRAKTFRYMVPPSTAALADVLRDWDALHAELAERLHRADGLDLAAIRHPLPIKFIKLSLGQWFRFTLAHERRHLWQARQVRQDAAFPAA